MTEVDKRAQVGEEEELTPREKAAILMVSLGEEAAGEIMKYMADFEIEEMTQIITDLKNLPTAIQDQVLEEFEQHLLAGEWVSQGGFDFARAALERAVGPRRAQEILDRINSNTNSGFYMLKNVAPEQIAPFIGHEHPQSDRVRDFIAEEMEFLGPMRLSEVEDIQLRIVQKVRQLEEQGQVNIVRGVTDDTFV